MKELLKKHKALGDIAEDLDIDFTSISEIRDIEECNPTSHLSLALQHISDAMDELDEAIGEIENTIKEAK